MALADYPGYEELLASGTHLKCQVPNCKWRREFNSLAGLETHLQRTHNVSKADLQYHWVHQDARAKHERCAAGLQRCIVFSLRVDRASHELQTTQNEPNTNTNQQQWLD